MVTSFGAVEVLCVVSYPKPKVAPASTLHGAPEAVKTQCLEEAPLSVIVHLLPAWSAVHVTPALTVKAMETAFSACASSFLKWIWPLHTA